MVKKTKKSSCKNKYRTSYKFNESFYHVFDCIIIVWTQNVYCKSSTSILERIQHNNLNRICPRHSNRFKTMTN